jgi:type III secretion protein Q
MPDFDSFADAVADTVDAAAVATRVDVGPEIDGDLDPKAEAGLACAPTEAAGTALTMTMARTSVTADFARLSRLVSRGCSIPIPALNAWLTVRLAQDAQADWSSALAPTGPFGAIELAQGARLLRGLSAVDLTNELAAADERWEWLQAAVIGRLGGTPFESADRLVRTPLADIPDPCVLQVVLRTASHAISTHARASAAVWIDLLARGNWTPQRTSFAGWAAQPYEIVVRIARHTLPAAVARSLATGDILLPDSPAFTCDSEGTVRFGAVRARVRYQAPCTLEVIEMEGQLDSDELETDRDGEYEADYEESEEEAGYEEGAGDDERTDEDDAPLHEDGAEGEREDEGEGEAEPTLDAPLPDEGADDDTGRLDALPVTLDFELGRARLLLGELRTLGPGAIVPFKGGSPASVAIRSGGRTLGRGEVVDVSGRLGIRIIEWEPK